MELKLPLERNIYLYISTEQIVHTFITGSRVQKPFIL